MTAPLAFLNGAFIAQSALSLSVTDAGFVSGVTVTDFCRTYAGRLFRYPDHLKRFRADCATLGVPLNYDDATLTHTAETLIAHNRPPAGELALITFATPGPLAYLSGDAADGPPTLALHTAPLAVERYRRLLTEGAILAHAGDWPAGDLFPAAVKHRSRLPWWLAAQKFADQPGVVPVLTGPGGVPDTALAAVLVRRGDALIRPPVRSVLESVSLQVVAELAPALGLTLRQQAIDFRDLARGAPADEVWLAGSGFGVAGVRELRFGDAVRRLAWPGEALVRMQAAWGRLTGT